MDQVMALFRELVDELAEAKDTNYLEYLKRQIEEDFNRIGREERLMEKYEFICNTLNRIGNGQ
jgi:hypothetical protein